MEPVLGERFRTGAPEDRDVVLIDCTDAIGEQVVVQDAVVKPLELCFEAER